MAVRVDECRAGDARVQLAVALSDAAFEKAADNALLPPRFTRAQLSIGVQAGHLGRRAGAARRAVVGASRTKNEILAVCARHLGRAKKFNVIDFRTVLASNLLLGQ